ncbi:hypothetical protein D3C76_1271360 [compost metagenome]
MTGGAVHRQDALGFHVAGLPVAVVEAVDAHAATAAAAGVDELVIAYIDAGMADAATATVVEEHDIAGLQLAAGDHRGVQVDHLAGGARQLDAGLFLEQVADEAAAVEAGLQRTAAEAVRRTHQFETALQQAIGQGWHLIGLVVGEVGQVLDAGLAQQRVRRAIGHRGLGLELGLLLHITCTSGEKQGESQRHEGCEALQHGHDRVECF